MAEANNPRRSHCRSCGTRLSVKTPAGKIKWQPSRVDDKGIYCASCAPPLRTARERRSARK